MDTDSYRVWVKDQYSDDFQIIGGPLDKPQNAHPLFYALGLIASNWARLEQHLNILIMHVNAEEHSVELFDPNHPVSFRRKIKVLKTWFNHYPALINFTEDVRGLTSDLKGLGDSRNLYLHSILETWDQKTETAHFKGIKYEGGDNFTIKTFSITLDGLMAFAKLLNIANRRLSLITRQLFTPEALDILKQSRKRVSRTQNLIRRFLAWCGGSK